MARNSLYPGYVKLQYTSNAHVHYATLPVKPYLGAGGVYWLETRLTPVGDSIWTDKVNDFINVFKALLPNTATITNAELWTLASPTADPVYVDGMALSVAGTGAGGTVANGQLVMTMRSKNGGILRIYVMEGNAQPNEERFAPTYGGNTQVTALHTHLLSNTTAICARDGGFAIAGIRSLSKTNDALRKAFLLS